MKRVFCFTFLAIVALCILPLMITQSQSGGCLTATCTAAGVSEAQFLAALPAPGNTNSTVTVNIPSGTAGWTTALTYSIPSAVTTLIIQGATTVNCTGTAGTVSYSCAATDGTVFQDNINGNTWIQITTNGTGTFLRWTGITMAGGTATAPKFGALAISGSSQNFRADHDHFNIAGYMTSIVGGWIRTYGQIYGVADHSVFDMGPNVGTGTDWNGVQSDLVLGDFGDALFAASSSWGSANFLFVESNQFNGGYSNDCDGGGRQTIRYNKFSAATVALQSHATKSDAGALRGCRAQEFYHNYMAAGTYKEDAQTGAKGATQLVWGNTMEGAAAYRFWAGSTDRQSGGQTETNTPNGWGYCGTAVLSNGTGSGWDGNAPAGFPPASSLGYPCLDGIGRGLTVQALNGANFPNRLNSVTGTIAWPHQYLEPIYLFMNAINGAVEYSIRDTSTTINVDLFVDNPTFNGTTGTGYGLLSARPATCTPGPGGTYYTSPTGSYGVAYWATDTNTLYVCTAAGTWTAIYTPYTYPHPLTGSSPAVSFSPASVAFGNQTTGTTSAAHLITLQNTGTATLAISSITVAGTNPSDFAQTNNCAGSVLAGGSCTVSVTFTPASAASFSATISVADNASGSPQTVPLTGTGVTATAAISFSPTSLAFGNQPVAVASAPLSTTVTNAGSATLTITAVGIAGSNAADFTQTNNCGSLAPTKTCAINVTFKPLATGTRSASVSITDNAAGSPQSVPLTGTGTAAAVGLSPSSLTFAAQTTGTTSAAQNVTLTNTGSATLTISSITITGTNASDFGQSNNCGGSVLVNGSCVISVNFTPSAAGSRTASVSIADNASGSPQTIALSGTGATATAGISFAPTSVSFGSQVILILSAPTAITVTNTGSANLVVSGVSITGTNATDFSQTNTCATVTPSHTCTINVTFRPTATGSRAGNVSVTDNAAGSPQTVALSGTGTAPGVSLAPSSVNFGNQPITVTSASQVVQLYNTGGALLTISSIAITGANAADFAQTNNCGTSVLAGGSCTFTLTFTPNLNGSESATLTITDNASGSPQTVPLSGVGYTPTAAITISPNSLTFATQTVGSPSNAQSIIVTNTGTAAITFSSISITGTNAGDYGQTNTCGSSLPVNTACAILVTFMPTAAGSRTANVSIADNVAGSPQTVALTGMGIVGPLVAPDPGMFAMLGP